MRKYIILLISLLICLNSSKLSAIEGLPIDPISKEIDYTSWDWQEANIEWPNYIDGVWKGIHSPFSMKVEKNELMYNIFNTYDPKNNILGDWTVEKGWRLVFVNLKGKNPYFILYNPYSSVLRAFLFLGKDDGGTFKHYAFSLEPVNKSVEELKLFSYGSDALAAVNGKEKNLSVTVFSTGAANQWIAFETPILFDNKVKYEDYEYKYSFLGCDNYDLKFKITGELVPAGGSSVLTHSGTISPNTTFNAKEMASKIHTPIKSIDEWSKTIFKEAKSINESNNKYIPSVVKKLGKSLDSVSGVAKIASTLSGISGGIEVLASIFDFFTGGSKANAAPVSYKVSLEGSGSVFISRSIIQNTLKVPASLYSDVWRSSWEYNGAMGLFSLEETPVLTEYSLKGSVAGIGDCNAEHILKTSADLDDHETSLDPKLRTSTKDKYKTNRLYKLTNDIKLNKKEEVEIVSVKTAILVTEYNSSNIMEFCHYVEKDGGSRGINFVDLFLSKGFAVVHKFEMTQEVPENASIDAKKNIEGVYEYGTRYVSPEELRDMAIPQNKVYRRDNSWKEDRSDISLGIIVRYKYKDDPTGQLRTYKGKFKCDIKDESDIIYTTTEVPNNSSLGGVLGLKYYEDAMVNLPAYNEEMVIDTKSGINARNPIIVLAPGFISEVGFTAKSTSRKSDSPYEFLIESFAFGNDNTGIPILLRSTRNMQVNNNKEAILMEQVSLLTTEKSIALFPNPTDGILNFRCSDAELECSIQIYNMAGALVYANKNIVDGNIIDLTNEAKGIYIAKILVGGEVKTEKIIIK